MNNIIICLLAVVVLFAILKYFRKVEGMSDSPISQYLKATEALRPKHTVKGPCVADQWHVPYAPSYCGSYIDNLWHFQEPRKILIDNQLNCKDCADKNYVLAPEGVSGYDPKKDEFIQPDLLTHYIDHPHSMSAPMGNGLPQVCPSCAQLKSLTDKECGCSKKSLYVVN